VRIENILAQRSNSRKEWKSLSFPALALFRQNADLAARDDHDPAFNQRAWVSAACKSSAPKLLSQRPHATPRGQRDMGIKSLHQLAFRCPSDPGRTVPLTEPNMRFAKKDHATLSTD